MDASQGSRYAVRVGTRADMHALIDQLPEQELVELHEIAKARRGGNVSDPLAGVSKLERERFHAQLREAEAEFSRGEGIPATEAIRRLRDR